MAVTSHVYESNGFFGIGIVNNVNHLNIGTLWRSAYILGASYIFTVDKKYKKQLSDVTQTWKKIPLYHYKDIDELSDKQLEYAANDVIYLHRIKAELEKMLLREKRMDIFNKCLSFLDARVELDQNGFKFDIFEH